MTLPIDEVEFMGPKPKIFCPACYSNLLQVSDNLPHIRCPVCNVNGVISTNGGEMRVEWDDDYIKKHRLTEYGLQEHQEHIKLSFLDYEKNMSKVKKLSSKYKEFGRIIAP